MKQELDRERKKKEEESKIKLKSEKNDKINPNILNF